MRLQSRIFQKNCLLQKKTMSSVKLEIIVPRLKYHNPLLMFLSLYSEACDQCSAQIGLETCIDTAKDFFIPIAPRHN